MALVIHCRVEFVKADSSVVQAGNRKIKIAPAMTTAEAQSYSFNGVGMIGPEWFGNSSVTVPTPDPMPTAGYSSVDLWNPYYLYHSMNVRYIKLYVTSDDTHNRVIQIKLQDIDMGDPTKHYFNMYYSYIIDGVSKITDKMGTTGDYTGYSISTTYFNARRYADTIPWYVKKDNGDVVFGKYRLTGTYKEFFSTGTPENINRISSSSGGVGEQYTTAFQEWLAGYEPEDEDDEDPYPDPDDDDDSDDPDVDPLPGISVVGSGFATIFTPTKAQLRNLSSLFWNETIFDFFQNLVENISDMFLSLAMVPFVVPAGSTVSVTWLGIDTAVNLTLASAQFLEFNMGSINLGGDSRIWRSESALDYSPFSQLGIYLPFIGFRDLDIDDCRGKVINLKYRIDILSGECVAIIKVGGAVMYQFSGNCLTQIPITNEGMQSLVSDAVQVGLSFAAVSSSGGAASAEIAGETGTNLIDEIKEFRSNVANTGAGRQLASTTANAVIGGKPMYGKTGSVSGAGGLLAVRQPYLYLKTPVSAIPNYYRRYCGYPCNKSGKLSSFSGYTVVEDIRLNHLVATSPEVSEIYNLLKGGVIV